MRTLRASEIGTYLYCKRAWWYLSQGIETQNQTELAEGTEFHRQHGRKVMQAGLLRLAGWVALLLAIVMLAVGITYLLVVR